MGARGPKPGFKKARADAAAKAAAHVEPNPASPATPVDDSADLEYASWQTKPAPTPPVIETPAPVRPAIFWENPAHLEGDALRALGHKRGLSLSAMAAMTDEKIRMELRYVAYARSHEADAELAGA